ncbi:MULTISPECIES: VWA domain-containing protein [unclassified Imperialibacter]|uniref:vWA domain-containing protein n=1 Tax=unclassified Imperialibacter TaxID=2629706 RepID=UPI001257CC41|nr:MULTISPECIES: VWA domain-containing protein [unclassified Imperialibacter]CAD5251404.1 conserved membrane hypothetical protein [Imperialibacter sp. 75]CAD5266257.1 conserved membrane hypothetical protein [Imperialibacter sp. 89]VVT23766.1 conserved membrane hypothetical protein [Imperialibacter sp. EC-SDR9]
MNFLFPQFLWALLALSIPILIHLFNFRRAKKIYFSNVNMLRHVKQTSSSKLKLKHWLVLFSRLATVFFLVMAFAQPFMPSNDGKQLSGDVVLYLDNSQSMSNLTGTEAPGLDVSIGMISEVLKAYPRETRFQLITNDFAPFSNHAKSKVDVEELLTELSYSSIVRSPDEIVGRMELGATEKDIYWISDFAYSPEQPVSDGDSVNNFKLVAIAFPVSANIFIDTVYLESPFLIEGQTNTLFVSLRNTGEEIKTDMPVKFFVNDIQAGALTTDLVPNGQTTLSFELNMALEEFNRCHLSIDDFPILFDNEFYLTLNQSPRVRIMEIRGRTASSAIGRVFANELLFDLQSFNAGNIDYGSFEDAELLVINEVDQLNSGLEAFIKSSLDNGRTVLIIPSSQSFDGGWTNIYSALRQSVQTNLQEIAQPDLNNPFFKNIFEASADKMEMPAAAMQMSWGNNGDHLLKYRSGAPYLTRTNASSGVLYLLAASLAPTSSTFSNNALFVPIMYKMAIGARSTKGRLYYTLDEILLTVNGSEVTDTDLYKLSGNGQEIVPGQQSVGANVRLELPRFMMQAGYYDVKFRDELVDALAFNLEKGESQLKPLPEESVLELFNTVEKKEIINVLSPEDLEKNLNERFNGKELWKYALILALAFLLIEVLLLRFL